MSSAFSQQCPLPLSHCWPHTITSVDLKEMQRDSPREYEDLTANRKSELVWKLRDSIFREGDEVRWKLSCDWPVYKFWKKDVEVPFAVSTSMGLYVRVQQEEDSDWQVANMSVAEFDQLNCKTLGELHENFQQQTVSLTTFKQKLGDAKEDFCYDRETKDCTTWPAKLFLFPHARAGDVWDTEDEKRIHELVSRSVSELIDGQKKRLGHEKARVAMFFCGDERRFAWMNLLERSRNNGNVLMIKEFWQTEPITMKLGKVRWSKRCNFQVKTLGSADIRQ